MTEPSSPARQAHPTEIIVHQISRELEIAFDDDARFRLPFEFLRVSSPSAEVRGHGPGQETLQLGKRDVGIASLEPVGNYGVRPVFSDGHDSGIFSWIYLYELGISQASLWAAYLERVARHGGSRDPDTAPANQDEGAALNATQARRLSGT